MILDFRLKTACAGPSIKNLQSEIYNLHRLLVRDHAQHFGQVSVTHQATVTQLTLALGALGSQDMTQVRTTPLHLPGCSFLEALGGAFVGFQFRHKSSKSADSFQPSAFRNSKSEIRALKFTPLEYREETELATLRLRSRGWSHFRGCGRRRLFLFLLQQLLLLLRFLLGFFLSFLLPFDRRLFRRQNRVQRVAFLPRTKFYNAVRLHVLDQPLQNLPSQAGARHLTATEKDGRLYLVAFIQKTQHVIFLGLVIVVVHIDAELDLFHSDRFLVLLSLALFLFLLIQIFPVVHDPAHGRLRSRGNLNQVQILGSGHLERLEGRQNSDLRPFIVNHADFARPDAIVGADKALIDTALLLNN